jgi:hypothetical protein
MNISIDNQFTTTSNIVQQDEEVKYENSFLVDDDVQKQELESSTQVEEEKTQILEREPFVLGQSSIDGLYRIIRRFGNETLLNKQVYLTEFKEDR